MNDQHIVPLDDLLPHAVIGTRCMCDPKIELYGAVLVIIHNSYDGREQDEIWPFEYDESMESS